MRTQSRLILVTSVVGMAFASIHAYAQCYTPTGCESPNTFVATYNKWDSGVNYIRWWVSTSNNGQRIFTDAVWGANQWNNADVTDNAQDSLH